MIEHNIYLTADVNIHGSALDCVDNTPIRMDMTAFLAGANQTSGADSLCLRGVLLPCDAVGCA